MKKLLIVLFVLSFFTVGYAQNAQNEINNVTLKVIKLEAQRDYCRDLVNKFAGDAYILDLEIQKLRTELDRLLKEKDAAEQKKIAPNKK